VAAISLSGVVGSQRLTAPPDFSVFFLRQNPSLFGLARFTACHRPAPEAVALVLFGTSQGRSHVSQGYTPYSVLQSNDMLDVLLSAV
jgi:hypothetical protein